MSQITDEYVVLYSYKHAPTGDEIETIDYCSDGKIRRYRNWEWDWLPTLICPPEDPEWVTQEGEYLTPAKMSTKHRENCFNLVQKRFDEATEKDKILLNLFWLVALSEAEKRTRAK